MALALAVLLRVLAPTVIRRQVATRASETLGAVVEVGDVDLALWKGGLVLEDVVVRPRGGTPDAPPEPMLAWQRLAVEVRWLPLFRRTVELSTVTLEGPYVALDRLEDGTLNVEQLGSPAPVAPVTDTATTTSTTTTIASTTTLPAPGTSPPPWGFGVDHITIRQGKLRFRDFKLKSVEPVEVGIDAVHVRRLAFSPDVYSEPVRIRLAAKIDRGTLRVDTGLSFTPAGVEVDGDVKTKRLPLQRLRVYIPRVGWSDLRGELATALQVHFATDRRTEVSGTLILENVAVRVPALEEPAIAWRRLRVQAHPLDLRAQRVVLPVAELDGVTLPVRPHGGDLLPFLALAASEAASAAPPPAPVAPGPAAETPPWHWSVASLRVGDGHVRVLGPEEPLGVEVSLAASGLTAGTSDPAPFTVALRTGEGTVGVDGTLRIAPPGVEGTVTIDRLSVPEIVTAAAVLPPQLLQVGRLSGEVRVAAGAPAPAGDVRVGGTLTLADLWLAAADPNQFSVGVAAVTTAIDEVHVAAAPAPVTVRLARLEFDKPYVELSRADTGVMLPEFRPPPAPDAAPPAATPSAADTPPPSPPQIDVASLRINAGRVYVTDRTVSPFYTGALDPIDATAERVHWPDLAIGKMAVAATLDEKGKIDVSGTIAPTGSTVQVKTRNVLLPRFNPHALSLSSYSIVKGNLEMDSTATFDKRGYRADSQVTLHDFDLAGREGDSLFQEQFGLPLRMALALLRDVRGDIGLDIPVEADEQGTRVGLLSVVGQALRRALLNAIASPLKLAGMVFGDGGEKPGAPAPITYRPGRAALMPESTRQVEQLANLLASRPGLGVTLSAVPTPADVRWLREQALREELAGGQGVVGTLRTLPARGTRERVRVALEARARDEEGPLEPADAAALEEWLAERPPPSPDTLERLVADRLAALTALLKERYGLGPERVAVTPVGSAVGEDPPAVHFELGALGQR